jgi:ribose-phosphate pyrophosphokinase
LVEAAVINRFMVFSGRANPALAHLIARELGCQLGNCVLKRYADGEVSVQVRESVRRKEVFLMQPTSPPADDHLIELPALADPCRRAGAARTAAVVPLSATAAQTSGMAGGSLSWRG